MGLILRLLGPAGIAGAVLSLALAALLGLQTHKTHVAQRYGDQQHQLYVDEQLAHQRTINNYRAAAEEARKADAANVARVRAEQAAINQRSQNEYEARLADARARAERLRSRLEAGAHPGSPGAAPVSGAHGPSASADGPAAADGFSVSERLVATEQAIQLDELIKWVKRNLTVDYGNSSKSSPNGSR